MQSFYNFIYFFIRCLCSYEKIPCQYWNFQYWEKSQLHMDWNDTKKIYIIIGLKQISFIFSAGVDHKLQAKSVSHLINLTLY